MATLLRLPEVSAGATEAVLSEWLVPEGEMFRAGEPIALVETEKASVEIEAEADVMILRRLVANGSQVEVGEPLALLGAESERARDPDALLAELGIRADALAAQPAPQRREVPDAPTPPGPVSPAPAQPGAPIEDTAAPARRFISPLARKMIREAGLEPDRVPGTGPNGRIIRSDVEAAIAAAGKEPEAKAPTPAASPAQVTAQPPSAPTDAAFCAIPHSRLRRAIANRLSLSKQTIPHFYLRHTARIDELLALRARLNEVSPLKITINDLVLRAVAVTHREVSEANVCWSEEALHKFDTVDIGVAIASQRGLVTPVLRGVENATPAGIAERVRRFAAQADEGRLRQTDLEGGSISVTNLGMFGIGEFSAIINPPQSAILAVGAAQPAPLVVDGRITVATIMTLTLSVDHRAIDGALAARWMGVLVRSLEEPLRLLA